MADARLILMLLVVAVAIVVAHDTAEHVAPSKCNSQKHSKRAIHEEENLISHWRTNAQAYISKKLKAEATLNENKAKNIIMFLGDGMSLQTVAATRMYIGGEELSLSFEKFPHFGLAKTYAVDYQVADSANTATAYLTGVKGNYETIGVNAQVKLNDCDGALEESKQSVSIAKWAQMACKATGIVTTSRVTHASPAGAYAHIANRDWENDVAVTNSKCDPTKTIDIARQLIEQDTGKNFKVIMGGGRREFRDNTMMGEENDPGFRSDGRDLIAEWVAERSKLGNASYIWNRQALKNIDYDKTDYLLGLFEANHCMYNLDIANQYLVESEPSLIDMTEAAIKILQKEEQGYFLFVESARIDMAHHQNWARKALDETKEFSRLIEMVRQMTNESDTLIVVTADHSHVMSYNGYSERGSDILGLSEMLGSDDLPYPTLSYANGMGSYETYEANGQRKNLSLADFSNPDHRFMSGLPLIDETHGGDDVGVYASGPWSHLFVGNYEQNNIPVAMAYAAKIGPYNDNPTGKCSGAAGLQVSLTVIATLLVVARCIYGIFV